MKNKGLWDMEGLRCAIHAFGDLQRSGTKGKHFAHSWKVTGIFAGISDSRLQVRSTDFFSIYVQLIPLPVHLWLLRCTPLPSGGGTCIAVTVIRAEVLLGVILLPNNRGPGVWIQ